MGTRRWRTLIVDVDRDGALALAEALIPREHEVYVVDSARDALIAMHGNEYDVVVIGKPRDRDALDVVRSIKSASPAASVVIADPDGTLQRAIGAVRAQARDYLAAPVGSDAVATAVLRACEAAALECRLTDPLAASESTPFARILGESAAMRRVRALLERVRSTDATVMITGESGTGKELVARCIHEGGPRASGPFVAIHCSAIPRPLLESELFGHLRGAFTDASSTRKGLLLSADGGTLFLDEVGSMPLAVQAKLLRALQERTIRPVGERREIRFDARIVAATNKNLADEVAAGRFRADLYFRLEVMDVALPPLRARGDDVLLLARHFIDRVSSRIGKRIVGLTPAAARSLCSYSWPGNVRELANCAETAVAVARRDHVTEVDLPDRVRRASRDASGEHRTVPTEADLVPLEILECAHLARVMREVEGNKSRASKILGVDRKTLYRKLRQYHLEDVADEEG